MTVAGETKHCHHGNISRVLIRELLVFLSLLFFGCCSCGHYLSPGVFIMLVLAIHKVFDSSTVSKIEMKLSVRANMSLGFYICGLLRLLMGLAYQRLQKTLTIMVWEESY